MKYMFLTYLDENAWAALGESEQQRIMAECMPHVQRLIASGFLGSSSPSRIEIRPVVDVAGVPTHQAASEPVNPAVSRSI